MNGVGLLRWDVAGGIPGYVRVGPYAVHVDDLALAASYLLIFVAIGIVLKLKRGKEMNAPRRRRTDREPPILTVVGVLCVGVGLLIVLAQMVRPCEPQSLWTVMPYLMGGGLVMFGGSILQPTSTFVFLDHLTRMLRRDRDG